jgi:glycosyltransferase involved in cell wall biosynthesis
MNSQYLISIIIPIYNVERYIRKCIDSVLYQTFKDIEIILVEDGSQDLCSLICDEYARHDNRIKVIHKENGGASDARNKGVEAANGRYIMFVDSDDWIKENCLSDIAKIILETNVDIIIGHFELCKEFEDGIDWEDKKLDSKRINNQNYSSVIEYLTYTSSIPVAWRYIFKRQLMIDNKIYFLRGICHEDLEWVPRLICSANSYWLYENPFYIYRIRAGSITTAKTIKNLKDKLIIIESLYKYFLQNNDCAKLKFLTMTMYWQIYPLYLNYFQLGYDEKMIIKYWQKTNLKKIKLILKYNPKLLVLTHLVGILPGVFLFNKIVSIFRNRYEN